MRSLLRIVLAAGPLLLVTALHGQEPPKAPAPPASQAPSAPQAQGQPAKPQEPPIVVYRVDLIPIGSVFAMNEPTLEGDTYVFRSLPDRTLERLHKSKVKAVTRRSTDYSKEVVFQVEFVPTGSVLTPEEPVKKGTLYQLKTWRQGTLLAVKEGDVKKISRLTGFEAFKAEMAELGVVVLEHDTTLTGFKQTGDAPKPGAASSRPATAGPGNWTYQGTPGASDAYAPGNATVARPGDTPMAPKPTQPPR